MDYIHPKLVVTLYKIDLIDMEMFTCIVSNDLSFAVKMFFFYKVVCTSS